MDKIKIKDKSHKSKCSGDLALAGIKVKNVLLREAPFEHCGIKYDDPDF